ncbi:uncharacterized UDP-glucosyltransferase YjiC-like isoform X1 [Tetranychus urticae]|uniref:UDP-glycosyltransferase 202A4 n=1 Tax=Tetranychus urticae TaxID=32264 RepID=T1KUK8_TETUR|nr:uncharacterized UDP-glucosyltransferase YjiC-like [Tetranychus urticae]XP_015790788.1 uncharacterized UDP-glucosyltransferase YjiC-like isoform X1 [Tetranychus urticae]AHX56878.1 UDP-glycosyltransferase 202A4 [Tetranychus urticae]
MDEKGSLKVLMTSMIGLGHLNACIGIGSLLRKRGHQVYFAHFDVNKEVIEKHGFHYISLCEYNDKNYPIMNGMPPNLAKMLEARFKMATKFSPLDILKKSIESDSGADEGLVFILEAAKGENCAMLNIIEKIKPDVCLVDHLWTMPWTVKASCPVIPVWSASPVDLYNGPPMGSGYSLHEPPQLWSEYLKLKEKFEQNIVAKAKELFTLFDAEFKPQLYAKQLGIYIFPGPLDYHELGSPKENWVRLDSSIRAPETQNFELPEKLKDKPGKLIYVSMGTVASVIPQLMEMIVSPLAKSRHRFIVSTGVYGGAIELHDNMWGDKYINQIALLPKVDLFITHGGSNSLVEGLSAGKPLIVIPQFGDQPDNAQRIVDLGLGVRINLHEFSGEKLSKAIEDVLNNKEIHSNVARVSEELKRTDSRDKVISLIEQLARNKTL